MEFSLRKSISFNKKSHGSSSSSSSSFKRHSHPNNISSSFSSYYNCDDDDDGVAENHPILSHPHNHAILDDEDDDDDVDFPTMMSPTSPGEVIVKIDNVVPESSTQSSHINRNDNNNDTNNNKISKEFSFQQPNNNNNNNNNNNVGNDPPSKLIGRFLEQQRLSGGEMSLDMDMDMDELRQQQSQQQQQQQQQQHQVQQQGQEQQQQQQQQQYSQLNEQQQREHSIRRQMLQGLPPLPPDVLTRQTLSRNQSDVQSPDSSNYSKGIPQMNNNIGTNNNNNNSNSNSISNSLSNSNNNSNNNINANVVNNVDGLREVRVSFQESFNSELGRRRSSIYSTVEADDSASSSASSTNGDDEEDGSRHGHGLHSRKSSKTKINNNNNNNNTNTSSSSDEVLRCTSSTSSKRMASSVSISKTKSRLMDPPSIEQRSGLIPKSGPLNMRSGLLGKSSNLEDEEDDPFLGDDLPEEFKKGKISTLVILEWLSLFLLVGALICSLVIPVWRKKSLWHMRLWKWQVLVLVLICGRLVSGWGIKIIVFFIERNFLLRKRVLYFVYGLKKAVQNVIWLGLVLLTWHFLFDKRVEKQAKSKPLKFVTQFLVICEIGAVIWLLKTLLVKVCASFFHVNAFFDRIQESLFNQFVIETLSGPPLFDFTSTEEERAMNEVQHIVQTTGISVPADLRASVLSRPSAKSIAQGTDKMNADVSGSVPRKTTSIGRSTRLSGPISSSSKKQDEGITIENLHKLNQNNVSAWNMKRLMKIVRHGFLTTLDEQIVDATHHQEDDSSTQIRSEVEAKAAAKKMFRNVARPRSKYIYLTDLLRFMREDEALKTMSLFEGAAETERISKSALKNWVVNAFRERRAIALTLSDTKTAVNKLHKMVNVIVSGIIIVVGVTLLDIVTSQNLVFLSSQIVVVAFVFGNTCKNVFESIIFLFVIHPFDVGDRCEIDGVQMVVEEMNILTTVFLRYDNQKIYFPNYILLTKPIHNFYRSPDMGDAIEILFHIATPAEKITLIRQRIASCVNNKKEHWYPDPMIVLKDAESLHMLRVAVWLQHRMNHQDMGERWARRASLMEECVKIFRELDLEYRIHPLNVNINSMPIPQEIAHP